MILVDTSVWVDHLNEPDPHLQYLLNQNQVIMHPYVLGEIALGKLRRRDQLLNSLRGLAMAAVATDYEVIEAISLMHLDGVGIGYVDAHLLVSTKLDGLRLWTRDKRLSAQAERLGVQYSAVQ